MEKGGYTYIMSSGYKGTLYIGVTSNLPKRNWEHKNGIYDGFSKRYGCKDLVWYRWHETIEAAITDEKKLKKLNRGHKVDLIEHSNPTWQDKTPELRL